MYNYTIKAYKPVKCTLKTQIEVLPQASVHIRTHTRAYAHTHTQRASTAPRRAPPREQVYYRDRVLYMQCTPPLIHDFEVQGSLLEKFYFFSKQKFHTNNFLFFSTFMPLKNFFIFYFSFLLRIMVEVCIFAVESWLFLVLCFPLCCEVRRDFLKKDEKSFGN